MDLLCTQWYIYIARKQSCGNVMFSHASVCPLRWGSKYISHGKVPTLSPPPSRRHQTSSSLFPPLLHVRLASGRYASCLNAVLFINNQYGEGKGTMLPSPSGLKGSAVDDSFDSMSFLTQPTSMSWIRYHFFPNRDDNNYIHNCMVSWIYKAVWICQMSQRRNQLTKMCRK